MELKNKIITEYIDDVDSSLPAPGGGSVAALVGALGAALARMAGHLSVEKKKFTSATKRRQNKFILGFKELVYFKNELVKDNKDDAISYNAVIDAYKSKDKVLIEHSLKTSAFVALEMQESSYKALSSAELLIDLANKNLLSDLKAGAILLDSCCEIASFNVIANANLIEDVSIKNDYLTRSSTLVNESKKLRRRIINKINKVS